MTQFEFDIVEVYEKIDVAVLAFLAGVAVGDADD